MISHTIGIMSGTSVDAVDGVIVAVDEQRVGIEASVSLPIPVILRNEAIDLIKSDRDSLNRAHRLGNRLTALYEEVVESLRARRPGLDIEAIGCHGQTLRHFPNDPGTPYTVQVVNGAMLAVQTGLPCVTDFRSADMALGGQGAPLAPGFHASCFSSEDEERVILNLGGIGNVTILPAGGSSPVIGFDTGPANGLMDLWVRRTLNESFDENGAFAASGSCIDSLKSQMLADAYFDRRPPKSTGREYFGEDWLNAHLSSHRDASPADVQATLLEVSAQSIADSIRTHCPEVQSVYACGGGTKNKALMTRLGGLLSPARVLTTAALGVSPEWVEATAFGWLAYRRLRGLAGNLPSVTGASRAAVLGALYHP